MPASPEDERLDAALGLAKRIADASDALGQEVRLGLAHSSRLSEAGIELALREHLETHASAADRASLARATGRAARCHVVLSANVVTGALRAIVLGLLTADVVFVRPSRRDPVLASVLVRELARLQPSAIALVEAIAPASGDEVHAYGSDATLAAIGATLPSGVVFRGHGSGFGVALIDRGADLNTAAHALACDVIPFDQGGCLSPRVALVLDTPLRARTFARLLDEALDERACAVPRGELAAETRAELSTFVGTMAAIAEVVEKRDHVVAFDAEPRAVDLPPAARAVTVLTALDANRAGQLLGPVSRWITSVGVSSDARVEVCDALRPDGARLAKLGSMQKPPLDGPVDQRGR